MMVIDQLVPEKLLGERRCRPERGHAIDRVHGKMEAIEAVQNRHVEGCRGRPPPR